MLSYRCLTFITQSTFSNSPTKIKTTWCFLLTS